MTLRVRVNTEIPADTAELGRKVLPETDCYRVIGDRLGDIVRDEDFAELYEPTGRNAVWPSLLAMVTVFQFQEDIPDREAAEMAVRRIDWKYALHLSLGYAGFHFTDLHNFRQRLLDNEEDALVFDALLDKIQACGFLKKRSRQRTDSSHVIGVVQKLARLELVTETLRMTLREIKQADEGWYTRVLPVAFCEVYLHRRRDYRLSDAERQAALRQTGQDGFWLLTQIDRDAPLAIRELAAVRTLRTIWEQQYERIEGQVRERAKMIVDAKELIISPHEIEARAAQKRGKSWLGTRVHLTETAYTAEENDGEPNWITDVTTDIAPAGDTEALPEIRANLKERNLKPEQQIVDAGYISGPAIAESRADGVDLHGPARPDPSPKGFQLADFQIDLTQQQATCPAGKHPVKWTQTPAADDRQTTLIHFGRQCTACPFFGQGQCTASARGRTLSVTPHYPELAARRQAEQTPEFWQTMKRRSGIEGTISEFVRQHGGRRSRYRGLAKTHLQNLFKAAAVNLKRLTNALLTHQRRLAAAQAAAG
jgi:transposase